MLYGRRAELAVIGRLIKSARSGHGGGLVLRGEPGIGKSALLAQAGQRARGFLVLRAAGGDREPELAHALLQQLLQPVLGGAAGLPEGQAAALRIALGLQSGEPPDPFLVSLAALTLLSDAATVQPVLCLVDDVHGADRPSRDVLAFIARRLDSEPVALLAAERAAERAATADRLLAPGIGELRLAGLPPDSATALLGKRFGARMAPAVRDALVRGAGGNPLALIEIPRTLTAGQLAGREPLPEPLPLGGELERAFALRARRLPPGLRTLALVCAAEGSGSAETISRAAARLGLGGPAALDRLAGLAAVEGAEQHLASYQDWAESAAAPEATALAARSRALLTEGAGAGVLYRQALQAHAVTERPMDQARTALLYGEYLRRQRRRAEARALLRAAVDAFERIGAPLWAARARAELRAAGETTAPRSPASLDRLTPQELQVARLVSQGMTNRGAAAQLFISPRTVDHHLRSVFRKLGIASRAELIRHIVATDGNSPAPQPRIPAGTHHPGRLALCSSSTVRSPLGCAQARA